MVNPHDQPSCYYGSGWIVLPSRWCVSSGSVSRSHRVQDELVSRRDVLECRLC